jgi:hypothetical protein
MKPQKKLTVDLRGLTDEERKVGAVVEMGRGTYYVNQIAGGKADLRLVVKA